MILQSMDFEHRADPCCACHRNSRTDHRERVVSMLSVLAFLLCGMTVVLLDGSLMLAVCVGLMGCVAAALLTILAQKKMDMRRLRACGGCR